MSEGSGVIARHGSMLSASLADNPVSLGEGDTPLLRLVHLPARHGIDVEIWCKFEGANPTGSFKDRGMAVAITAARNNGEKIVVCASTGNTSASAAAYAARAGMRCAVLLPEGKVAAGKLAQARAHGARILSIKGSFDDAMKAVRALCDEGYANVNSINPMRLQGQKTIAFEVIHQLGRVPDVHALPVGNAGNITAHWMGYSEAAKVNTKACSYCGGECEFIGGSLGDSSRPVMIGVQASGAAPFIAGHPIEHPETIATAIRIGNPQSWDQAQAAVRESKGRFLHVDDDAMLSTQRDLASCEGIFCEPSSAAGLAGLLAEAKAGKVPEKTVAVCTLTGHGLKDPDIFSAVDDNVQVDCDLESLRAAIEG